MNLDEECPMKKLLRGVEISRVFFQYSCLYLERALSFYSNTLPSEFSKFKSNSERMESFTNPDYGTLSLFI